MKTLTFEVPDEFYEAFQEIAAKDHRTVEDVALEWLAKEAADRRRPKLSEEERRAALEGLLEFAGAVSSGDPHSGDNDRIDADLAREYGSTHEEVE
ncbi:MAG TPA: hypothetical protein VNE39_19095 [Planctomycetota bacterium]|nr:hypothetical protein [Planctomycetota bacterium]